MEILIQQLIKIRVKNRDDLASLKRKLAKKNKSSCPSNVELLKVYHKLVKNKRIPRSEKLENLLRTRPIRSLSGIVNISALTKPYPCPGRCLYCPIEKGIPKSYVSGEPAVERAKALNYDPYLQTKKRIEMLKNQGHPTDKIELRIVGGTWSYYPKNYQTWFIKKCFDAANDRFSKNLKMAQKLNERAKNRIIGLSVETRPDFINIPEIKRLRNLGVTMVELGVQSIYDNVLKLNLRGHKVESTILATKLLKDAGFKVLYQMMPNLLGSNPRKDKQMFKELFLNPGFQPDLLKIYPCALLKEASLYNLWKKRKYRPYSRKTLINLIKEIKKEIPFYVRIQRIARDISSKKIVAGPAKISNMRQIIAEEIKKENWQCKCIRCREVRENYPPSSSRFSGTGLRKDKLIQKLKLFREDYDASGGKEIFLTYEDKNRERLYGLLRLRIPSFVLPLRRDGTSEGKPSQKHFLPTLRNSAIIREVHIYGQLVPISEKRIAPQHRGLGKKLIKEAEKIIKKGFNLDKIFVISGVGARNYYRKLGYKLKDNYMAKDV